MLYDFGMIGLGTMGRNFLLNVADHGFSVVGLDKDDDKARLLEREGGDRQVKGATETEDFVKALSLPRKIMMLVPAGKVVDAVIEDLLPHLDDGDLIIDGGNTFFEDTNRREVYLREKGIRFLGVGVSGGAKGARFGPSIMPGGEESSYEIVQPILEAVAAKVAGEPCVTYLGNSSAGNYVKMVHNGIEYGLMQLTAEAYDLLKRAGGLTNEEIHQAFTQYNEGKLASYLIEISAKIMAQKDTFTAADLVDKILDKGKQKGTGKWTSQNSMDLGIAIPTIDAAVAMRGISAFKAQRTQIEAQLPIHFSSTTISKESIVALVEDALYFSFLITYSQGMTLLAAASEEYNYNLNMEDIARIWRGGCIIRAGLLEKMRQAYDAAPQLSTLLLSEVFKDDFLDHHRKLRLLLKLAMDQGIPTLCLSAALGYFDAYRTGRLPLNLVQAQRDFFGSHTYERIDMDGIFHFQWEME